MLFSCPSAPASCSCFGSLSAAPPSSASAALFAVGRCCLPSASLPVALSSSSAPTSSDTSLSVHSPSAAPSSCLAPSASSPLSDYGRAPGSYPPAIYSWQSAAIPSWLSCSPTSVSPFATSPTSMTSLPTWHSRLPSHATTCPCATPTLRSPLPATTTGPLSSSQHSAAAPACPLLPVINSSLLCKAQHFCCSSSPWAARPVNTSSGALPASSPLSPWAAWCSGGPSPRYPLHSLIC